MIGRVRAWLVRLANVLDRGRGDREFLEELEANLELHVDDNLRLGMTPEAARREALLKLGGVDQARERHHERRGLPWLETGLHDLRFALRLLARSPGFTLVALAMLAAAIGASTVMFSVVNTLLLRPLPFPDPERLLFVQSVDAVRRQPGAVAPPDFYGYRSSNRTFAHLDAFYTRALNVTGGEAPERIVALSVSSHFFETLATPPVLGRGFSNDDEQWGAHRVALLGDGLWRRRFGADPGVLGRPMTINGEAYTIVGVLPPKLSFLGMEPQLYVPMAFAPGDHMNSHSNYFLRLVGRLRPGVTREQAAADLNGLLGAIVAEQKVNQGTAIEVTPLRDVLVKDVRQAVLVLLGAVGFVLLISCANLANLLLARGSLRRREIAVRLAMGASRGRLVRQLLTESVLLSALGGAAGLVLAQLSVSALNALSLQVLPRAEDIQVHPAVLAFAILVAATTGILFGLAPALQSVSVDVIEDLKSGARTASGGRPRLRAALVLAEVSLSLVLLVGAGLMVKSMYRLLNVDAGFEPAGVLTVQLNLPPEKYIDAALQRQQSPLADARAARFFAGLVDATRSVPGVIAAGAVNGLPLGGEVWGKNIVFYDRPLPNDVGGLVPIQYRVVSGDYFRALGIRVLSGRAFGDGDTREAPKVVIVNRELARRHWDGQDPIGKVISVNPPLELLPKSVVEEARRAGQIPPGYEPDRFTVVGVADDARYGGLSRAPLPLVYAPYAQAAEGTTNMVLVVRTSVEPLSVVSAIRDRVRELDRDQPLANIRTMEALLSNSVSQRRMQMNVLAAFAALAALLAATGIYGVMSYAVAQRAREMSIRMALGAQRRDVLRMVLRQGLTLVAIGLTAGILAALALTRVLRTLLFQVSPTDPSVFAAIVVLLTATAGLATYIPARRATTVDPLTALRDD